MTSVELAGVTWRKSSRSGGANGGGGNCVELAVLPDRRVAIRDSKDPYGGVLFFGSAALTTWLAGIKERGLTA